MWGSARAGNAAAGSVHGGEAAVVHAAEGGMNARPQHSPKTIMII